MKQSSFRTLTGAALKTAFVAGVVAIAASATVTLAGDRIPRPPACDREGECPAVYAPVKCDNGRIYSNSCYAWLDCATGCVPYGDLY